LKKRLLNIYKKLYTAYGSQHWWPGDTPFEVIVGAILTQNTAWTNVEKAINNLKQSRLLSVKALSKAKPSKIAKLIRPSGYYNIKTKRLKNFLNFLDSKFNGDLGQLLKQKTGRLRAGLLEINGIGAETADSILLYAANKPVFVIDAYTKRILSRHGLIKKDASYEETQYLFMSNIPKNLRLYNEYHALIVKIGKEFCRKDPKCHVCPLKRERKCS
jgi:endonuclease-3 related protein